MNWVKTQLGRLFPLNQRLAVIVAAFVGLFILAFVTKCHAEDAPYAQISLGSAIVRGPAPVLDIGFTWPSGFRPGDFWKGDLTLIGTSTYREQAAPNNAALRGMYVVGYGHLDFGLGLAYVVNPSPYNGLNLNFSLELAYRFEFLPITVTYSHMSDDGMKQPNLGRDIVAIGYRFGSKKE